MSQSVTALACRRKQNSSSCLLGPRELLTIWYVTYDFHDTIVTENLIDYLNYSVRLFYGTMLHLKAKKLSLKLVEVDLRMIYVVDVHTVAFCVNNTVRLVFVFVA